VEDWAKALAECIQAETEAFGEQIVIRDKALRASVGSTEQAEALEMSGYIEREKLAIVLPADELLALDNPPEVNEVLELRNHGYRIVMLRKLEAGHGFELQCELIPQYEPRQKPTDPIYITPNVVSELVAEIAQFAPTAPSNVTASEVGIPAKPSELNSATTPLPVDQLLASKNPQAPDQVTSDKQPTAPSNLESELPYIDMYLVMGQSNAHGHSPIADLTQEQSHNIHVGFHTSWHHSTSNATTTQYYSGFTSHMYIGETRGDDNETTVDSDKFGIEWGFAKQLEADHTGHDKIGIIKYAVGASTIDDNASFSDWDTTKNTECFQGFKNAIADAIPKIHDAGYNIRWQGFLWYQGESNGGSNPDTYQGHLEALIAAIETELGVTDLPCVFCAPADQFGNELRVNEAFNNLARTRNDYDFIKIADYHDGTYSNVHLSAQNMYDAGIAAGQAMKLATTHQASTSTPFTAADLTTRLWLDMDDQTTFTTSGGNVTAIADKSGNNYTFNAHTGSTLTAINAAQNGKNILRFDNNTDATSYRTIGFDATARHKFFFVVKVTTSDQYDALVTMIKGNPVLQMIMFNLSGAGVFSGDWYMNPGTHMTGNTANNLNQWVMLSAEFDVPANQSSAWLNGTAYNSNVTQTGLTGFGAMSVRLNDYQNNADSDWGEVIFAENITQAQSDQIEGYLAKKWDLVYYLPSTHPYKTYAP